MDQHAGCQPGESDPVVSDLHAPWQPLNLQADAFGKAGNDRLANHHIDAHHQWLARSEWNYNWLHLAKVIGRHPDSGTVDLAMAQGGVWYGVPVVGNLSGLSGSNYIPDFKPTAPYQTENGTVDLAVVGTADLWAVVAYMDGNSKSAIVIGFLPPRTSQVFVKTPGLDLNLHESGVYRLTTPDGATEIHYPDGTYIRVGQTLTPHNMAQENPDWNPPTSSTPTQFVFKHSSGFTLTFNGTTLEIGAGSQHPLTFADAIVSWLNSHTHSGVTTGSGNTGTPTTPISQSSVASTAVSSS
jgi:hypothetical protein